MNHTSQSLFDEHKVLHELKHYLPSQTPIKDFIHHNTLHALQHLKFYEAIFKASKIFGYQVTLELSDFRNLYHQNRIKNNILERVITEKKGAEALEVWKQKLLSQDYDTHNEPRLGRLRSEWKNSYHLDMDNLVHPLLFRILCSYLDQGISLWHFPRVNKGFLEAIRLMESDSYTSFFKTERAKALLMRKDCGIEELLGIIVGKPELYEEYLFDQQFSHHGWAGMVATVEEFPDTLLYNKKISLKDLIIFELLLEIDNLEYELGPGWEPMGIRTGLAAADIFADEPVTELHEVFMLWQDAFEWSYYDEVLAGVSHLRKSPQSPPEEKTFQAIFCIDERECSIRRHVESVDSHAETLGSPGFFGVEFYFQPEHSKFYEKLCPAPVTPKYLVKEADTDSVHGHELLYTKRAHSFLSGYFFSIFLGFWAGVKLLLNIIRPKMSPAISDAFSHMGKESRLIVENVNPADIENGLQVGFTIQEMANRAEGLLRGIGMIKNFAPLVYVVAHGSSSANNPHHGAHDCGACSGRPGAVNARVFAFMVNHPKVREILAERGIAIPAETQFIGALHDTASDLMGFYDEKILSEANAVKHRENRLKFEMALDLNAKERSRRFASIDTKKDIQKIRKAIEKRSVSFFEPRPELGHGTNSLCFVGRRELTKGLFLDRRAFMNSYDYTTDPEGKLLLGVMRPLPPVCGGINLEYYFSRVDNQKFGAGTKLPHNVMGLIGVANSSDGDLRPGLPLQMIEVHDPIRLLIVVEHFPEVVLKTIKSEPTLYEWFENEWVHLASVHPETGEFFSFKNHAFHPYLPLTEEVSAISDVHHLFENAKEMETNHILHATQENLPVRLIK